MAAGKQYWDTDSHVVQKLLPRAYSNGLITEEFDRGDLISWLSSEQSIHPVMMIIIMIVIKWKYSLFTKCLKSGSSATGPAQNRRYFETSVTISFATFSLRAFPSTLRRWFLKSWRVVNSFWKRSKLRVDPVWSSSTSLAGPRSSSSSSCSSTLKNIWTFGRPICWGVANTASLHSLSFSLVAKTWVLLHGLYTFWLCTIRHGYKCVFVYPLE